MVPMLLLSIFFVMLVVVYLLTIRRGAVVSTGYMATADALLRKRDYLGLLAVSNRHGEAIARVVQKVLDFMTKNPQADLQQAREIAETEGTRVAASLNNRVIYLADIGMIAPLLGLLGTVLWNYPFLRRAGSRYRLSALRSIVARDQRGAGQYRCRPGHRDSCDGLLRILSRPSTKADLGIGSCFTHVLALLSLQYGRPQRTPVLIEEEL
jgi:hypothetical protein